MSGIWEKVTDLREDRDGQCLREVVKEALEGEN